MKRKLWGPLLCGVLLCSLFLLRVPAAAEEVGTFGDDNSWSWSLDGKDCLTIEGSGEMPNFTDRDRPWESRRGSIRSVKVSDGVTSIGDYAFMGCANLMRAELPGSVTSIGDYAFGYCYDLTLSALPSGVTSIGDSAFYECRGLVLTELPSGVTSIGDSAFCECTVLALTELPSGVTSIGNYAFYRCIGLALTELPSGVTSIGDFAFSGCTSLALRELPSGLHTIGNHAFQSCRDLALTELPSGLRTIGDSAFDGCGGLTLSALPSGVTSIGNGAFNGCANLALTELPSGLRTIGNYAFDNCTGLTAVTFTGETAPSLGSGVFDGCSGLTMVYYPGGGEGYTSEWVAKLGLPQGVPAFPAYPVTVTPEGRGAASADFVLAPVGQIVTLTAEPESGWRLREWRVVPGGVTVGEDSFTMPGEAVEITAVFEELPAPPPVHVHSWSQDWSADAESHWRVCSGCGQRRDAAAHTPGEWVTDREATYTEEGRRHRACTVCGYVLETEAVPTLPRPSGPDRDSGGREDRDEGGFPPLTPRAEGGGVTVSPSRPEKGDTVTVRLRPRDGYETEGVSVTGPDGSALEVRENGNGDFTFTQPEGRVTVRASFRPVREPERPEEAGPFRDVRPGDWCFEAVRFVRENGLMDGYSDGRFGPDETLSRAQLAQILYNKEGRPEPGGEAAFSDVAADAWCAPAVRWAAGRGVAGGYSDGRFRPDAPVTREQLAAMLWRYAGSPAAAGKPDFTDGDETGVYAREAVAWAAETGVISGYGDGRLNPGGQATRAQAASMLKRFVELG